MKPTFTTITLRLPKSVRDLLATEAAARSCSMNAIMVERLSGTVATDRTDDCTSHPLTLVVPTNMMAEIKLLADAEDRSINRQALRLIRQALIAPE